MMCRYSHRELKIQLFLPQNDLMDKNRNVFIELKINGKSFSAEDIIIFHILYVYRKLLNNSEYQVFAYIMTIDIMNGITLCPFLTDILCREKGFSLENRTFLCPSIFNRQLTVIWDKKEGK